MVKIDCTMAMCPIRKNGVPFNSTCYSQALSTKSHVASWLKCKTHHLYFIRIYFSLLSFKFIQLKHFHKLLLNIASNCPFFFFFVQYFEIKKIQINDWKIFSIIFLIYIYIYIYILIEVDRME